MVKFKLIKLFFQEWRRWRCLPVSCWVSARLAQTKGRYSEAISLYRRGLKGSYCHPASLSSRLNLAHCLFRAGRIEEAVGLLRTTAAENPGAKEAALRLSAFQLWIGRSVDAAWSARRGLKTFPADPELLSILLFALADSPSTAILYDEAIERAVQARAPVGSRLAGAISTAKALVEGNHAAIQFLESACVKPNADLDLCLGAAQMLLARGKRTSARFLLRRTMQRSAEHPKISLLLAEGYLVEHESDLALYCAICSCRHSGWLNPRALHVLARCYSESGDRIAALLAANKAKEESSRLVTAYKDIKSVDKLIEQLS